MAFVLWARFVAVKKGLYSRQIHINCYFSKIMECVIDILYLCVNRDLVRRTYKHKRRNFTNLLKFLN